MCSGDVRSSELKFHLLCKSAIEAIFNRCHVSQDAGVQRAPLVTRSTCWLLIPLLQTIHLSKFQVSKLMITWFWIWWLLISLFRVDWRTDSERSQCHACGHTIRSSYGSQHLYFLKREKKCMDSSTRGCTATRLCCDSRHVDLSTMQPRDRDAGLGWA